MKAIIQLHNTPDTRGSLRYTPKQPIEVTLSDEGYTYSGWILKSDNPQLPWKDKPIWRYVDPENFTIIMTREPTNESQTH